MVVISGEGSRLQRVAVGSARRGTSHGVSAENKALIDDVRKERPILSGHANDTAKLSRTKGPRSIQGAVMRG
jgi:hypothetical protein